MIGIGSQSSGGLGDSLKATFDRVGPHRIGEYRLARHPGSILLDSLNILDDVAKGIFWPPKRH